jgi:hypothetical protein
LASDATVKVTSVSVTEQRARVYDPRGDSRATFDAGESRRLAILDRERAGCETYPIRAWALPFEIELRRTPRQLAAQARVAVPKLGWIPAYGALRDGEVKFRAVRLDKRPPSVHPKVWGALHTPALVEEAVADRLSRGQLKRIAAAALYDLLDWTGREVADDLGYRGGERVGYQAARGGRVLLATLCAWPWSCLPPGAPERGWWRQPHVRVGWQLWVQPVARRT